MSSVGDDTNLTVVYEGTRVSGSDEMQSGRCGEGLSVESSRTRRAAKTVVPLCSAVATTREQLDHLRATFAMQ